ncbi:hypothetical protein BDQ94DRAFT_164052 [Aspergillus welwitschiae]|uniref:Uncharacterized protein n=1 Tax=Aspergillus welwitschiae TaxID=1341132 RepID=A0A3F3PJ25_9EURO|nr:hypothetical protein BDQ94DRAFT_164052 [Aspergillus welwitschiae]RDH26935.1 hypothetical protein BDQ94DRAFT_164052 [Aspergillus welwitschiae]
MRGSSPPRYTRLQALRTTLGLQASHPVQIGAYSHAAVAKEHGIAEHKDLNPGVVDQSSGSANPLADDSEGSAPGQAFALLNEYMYVPILSTRLTQISALETSMREQKQWNWDIGETLDKLQKSSFGSGATNVTTRGKDTSF